MKVNKLCTTIARYTSGRELDSNIMYLLGELFDKYNIVNFKSNTRDNTISRMVLSTKDGENVFLNTVTNKACLIIKKDYIIEEHVVTASGEIYSTIYEQRPYGIIVSESRKEYTHDKDEKMNISYNVSRYTFTTETIEGLNPIFTNPSYQLVPLTTFRKVYRQELKFRATSIADFKTDYSSFIKTSELDLYGDKNNEYDSSIIHTYVNGFEIPYYNLKKGNDKLDVAYKLFMGVIDEDTMDQIVSIRMGELSKDTFDLYNKLGYKEVEDNLVSESLIRSNRKYKFDTKRLISENFNIGLLTSLNTRDELLDVFLTKPLTENGIMRSLK